MMTTTADQRVHPALLVGALGALSNAVSDVEHFQDAAANLDTSAQADAIALIQDLRYRLGQVEAQATMTLGKALGKTTANLSDGRQFTLSRTQDRTAWDHEDWKRDARRKVVEQTLAEFGTTHLDVVDMEGEVSTLDLGPLLFNAVAAAQEVHGSTAPRSTALKRLGLYASDYCSSSPGGWRLNVLRPTEAKPETTTEKDTTDA